MKRVLVVDDKENNLYYLRALLSAQGHAVDTARHGAEALVLARQQRPDMVIADLLMPVMDGYTLLRHWRADPQLRDIPFVVYTATYTEADDERLALDLGADAFILKPAEPFDFLDRIQSVRRQPTVAEQSAAGSDNELMVLYSQTLIRKLEEKSLQLERTNQQLEEDIAERQRAEETLRVSEANLAAAQRIAHFGSWELDLGAARVDDNPLRWSDEMFRIAGLEPQSTPVSNRLFFDLLPEYEERRVRAAMRQALQGREPYAIVHRLVRPDGDERIVQQRAQVVFDEASATPLKMIGTMHDITDQQRADQAVRNSEAAQRTLAAQLDAERALRLDAQRVAQVGSWETDIDSGHVSWSDETHRIFETDPATFRPLHGDFLARVHPEDRERVAAAFDDSLQHRAACAIEHRLRMDDGRVKFVEGRWQLMASGDGTALRAIGTCRDITEQRLAQAESQRTADLLRAVADNIPDAVYVKDLEGRYLLFNEGAARLVGHPVDRVLGNDDSALFTPAQAMQLMTSDRAVMHGGVAVTSEEVLTADGKTRTYLAVKAPYLDGGGDVLGMVGISRDISERKAMESALRKSESELRLLTEIMPQIVWIVDASGTPLHVNRQWQHYTGLAFEPDSPHRMQDAIHPDDRVRVAAHWTAAVANLDDFDIEYRLRDAAGSYRWMLGRALPMRDADGVVVKWFGTATDIDDIKRAAEALRTSEERFRLLSRATKDAIWDWDLRTDTLWWNEGFELLFGYDRTAVGPTIQSWTSRIHSEDVARVVRGLHEAIDRGDDTWSDDYRFRRADGSHAQVTDRGHVIRDEQGRPVRMVGGIVDMSERLALEEQLRQSQRLESLGQLTGGVAHDFNNLLTVILGNSELLAEQLAGHPSWQALAGMIASAALRGAELTQRLLAFARKQALQPQPLDANQLLDGLDGLLRRTLGRHVDIAYTREGGLWPALVDPAQLENAVLNLCLNARDAMPAGGWLGIQTANVHLDAAEPHGADAPPHGDFVMLAIADAGVGIPAEHLGRIFEPFFTTKNEGKGTGLGLAMVYGFIRQSGGRVSIDSVPGQGTTVRLYLPRATSAAVAGRRPPPDRAVTGGDETILLVEDDDAVRRYASDQLRRLGYRVVACGNGAQAMELLRDDAGIDLLFTDVAMPGMSGRQLADAARSLRPDVAVLYSSGYIDDLVAHQDSGVPLLGKPYRQSDIADAVRQALQRRGRRVAG